MQLTRREWNRIAVAGFASAVVHPLSGSARQSLATRYKGVTLGVQSYSFRDRPLDAFRRTADKFRDAGVTLSAYNISFQDSFSDAEIERGFEMAKALGAPCITASSNIKTVPRIAPIAARHGMRVGMHNHSRIDPNEFATPQNFEDAMKAGSHIVVNLDIGHFTAANFDAVEFLRRHHGSIVTLHIKDRKRNQGPVVPMGEGDAPIAKVLRLLRDEKWAIPANIEYEYTGGDTVEEVRRCLEYCRQQLDV